MHGLANAIVFPQASPSLASLKSRTVLSFCYWLTQVVMEEAIKQVLLSFSFSRW